MRKRMLIAACLSMVLFSGCSWNAASLDYVMPSRPRYHIGEKKPWRIGGIGVKDVRSEDWIAYTRNSEGKFSPYSLKKDLVEVVWKAFTQELSQNDYVITNVNDDPLIGIEIIHFEAEPISGDFGYCMAQIDLLVKFFRRTRGRKYQESGQLELTEEFFASAQQEIDLQFNPAIAADTLGLALQKIIHKVLASHVLHGHLGY